MAETNVNQWITITRVLTSDDPMAFSATLVTRVEGGQEGYGRYGRTGDEALVKLRKDKDCEGLVVYDAQLRKEALQVERYLALRTRATKLTEQIIRQGGRSRIDQDNELADIRAEIKAIEGKTEAQAEFA